MVQFSGVRPKWGDFGGYTIRFAYSSVQRTGCQDVGISGEQSNRKLGEQGIGRAGERGRVGKVVITAVVMSISLMFFVFTGEVMACGDPPGPGCPSACDSLVDCTPGCQCPCLECDENTGSCYEDCGGGTYDKCCCPGGWCYKFNEKECCDSGLCDLGECEQCVNGVCVDRCTYYYSDYCLECDGVGNCIVCGGRPGETCCDGTCCPNHKCCVDGDCIEGGCRPMFDLVESGECGCYAFECEGSITQTFIWYCEEYDGGCPAGTECKQTGTVLCYTTRTKDCIGECLVYGSDCAFGNWEYGPKALRVLCGCCP